MPIKSIQTAGQTTSNAAKWLRFVVNVCIATSLYALTPLDKRSLIQPTTTGNVAQALSFANDIPTIKYDPNWRSLDSRPIPEWYDEAKFGIFIHWGVYAVPSYGADNTTDQSASEWFWWNWQGSKIQNYQDFMSENYPKHFSYQDFAPQFNAELFDVESWGDIIAASGAKYVVFTSKHHEGFANWRSNVSWNWNSVDNGPHRDLVAEISEVVRQHNITMGLYFSLYEWFHPFYLKDRANNFTTTDYVDYVMNHQIHDLIENYKPSVLWADGDWEAPDIYWNSTELLAWMYNESPVKDTIVVNDRWGKGATCHHGGFFTCMDRFSPGKLLPRKWENCMTIDRFSWGFRRNANVSDYLTTESILRDLAITVSCGGNLLLNIGPGADGTIAPIFQQRLFDVGEWLAINGEAIYKTVPWRVQNDTVDIWYTTSKTKPCVYVIYMDWPLSGELDLLSPVTTSNTTVQLFGYNGDLEWLPFGSNYGMRIRLPNLMGVPAHKQPIWALRLNNVT